VTEAGRAGLARCLCHNLEHDPAHPRHRITEAGMGYRFHT